MMGPVLNRKSDLSVRNGVLLYKQILLHIMDYTCPAWRSTAHTQSGYYKFYNPSVFALLLVPPGT